MRSEVDRLKKELEQAKATHSQCAQMMAESHVLMDNLKMASIDMKIARDSFAADLKVAKETIVNLTADRDELRQVVAILKKSAEEDAATRAEMLKAIVAEHTKGFRKALRQMSYLAKVSPEGLEFDIDKDVYKEKMVPLDDIPEGTFIADDELAGSEEVGGAAPADVVIEEVPAADV